MRGGRKVAPFLFLPDGRELSALALGEFLFPLGTVIQHPVNESRLEADVSTGFFAPDPLMAQNFIAFGEELLIEG